MLLRALGRAVEGALLVLMTVLCADVFLGVVSRYVLRQTFTWYDEIARLCFVWIVFLGAAAGVRRAAHFQLHLVVDRLAPPLRRAAGVLASGAVMALGALLVWQGRFLVELGHLQTTPVMGLSKAYVYASMPVGGALIVLFAAAALGSRRPDA